MNEPPSVISSVLDVPTSGPLLVEKAAAPLVKYFPLAMSLSTDRIVSKDEAHGKHFAIGKTHVVAAGGREIDMRLRFPGANLKPVVRG